MDNINDSIFKAYDIRGVYPSEMNEETAFKIAAALVKFLNPDKLVVAQDARRGSDSLREAAVSAIVGSGVDVVDVGYATTPLFYYSVNKFSAAGGIMITASHNPPEYNGFKLVKEKAIPIYQDNGLLQIKNIVKDVRVEKIKKGKIYRRNLIDEYIDFLIDKSGFNKPAFNKRVIIDASNGMTGIILPKVLEKMNISYTPLFFELDGSFPNHSPDITQKSALITLKSKILESKADMGIIFDGDGDRLAILDRNGNSVRADFICALLAEDILIRGGLLNKLFFKPKFILDLRFSKAVFEFIKERGGVALRSKIGHSFFKEIMRENKAVLGAELSGHFYFKENFYTESAVLAMLRMFSIVQKSNDIEELVKPLDKYFHSGEINFKLPLHNFREKADEILNKLENSYRGAKIDKLDGLTVDLWDKEEWWFNIRPSNTEPVLRLVVEAKARYVLDQKIKELSNLVK